MYQVSDAYKAAMARPVQQGRVRGTIASSKGIWSKTFTESNVEKGSFSVTNQCSGNDNVEIGTVYTAQLSCKLIGMDIERYNWLESLISPSHELKTSEGWEAVPLGVFIVKEANWTSTGVEITAYDNMVKFDKSCDVKTSQGSMYSFLTLACNTCKVELAQTEEEIQALPNGNIELTLFNENDVETWRDIISWCAQTTGTFATIDRSGRLKLVTYGTDPVDEIGWERRITGAKFSDYSTRYTGMSCVNIAEKTTTYYNITPDDGLTYNLGSNPFLQTGFEDVITEQRRAVLNALTVIDYVPFEVSMIGTPAYDLGDVIVFTDGIADDDAISCITKYDWKYGGNYSITGVGQNPALASARSKSDKDITGLMKSGEENKIQYYTFTNADNIRIEDGETKKVIDIRFQSTQPTTAIFHAEILLNAETTVEDITYNDLKCTVVYYWREALVTDYGPVETWQDGKHILHLLYYFNIQDTQINYFEVRLKMSGGAADIGQAQIKSAIYGQNLYATDKFDGILKLEQSFAEMAPVIIPGITSTAVFGETVAHEMFERVTDGYEEDMSAVTKVLEGLTIVSITSDSLEVDTE